MNGTNHEEVFFNRAEVTEAEEMHCDSCYERVVFRLKDKDHEFTMGLSTVWECCAFAVKNGDLPKLPRHWVTMVDDIYGTSFSFDDDICYHDYNNLEKRE